MSQPQQDLNQPAPTDSRQPAPPRGPNLTAPVQGLRVLLKMRSQRRREVFLTRAKTSSRSSPDESWHCCLLLPDIFTHLILTFCVGCHLGLTLYMKDVILECDIICYKFTFASKNVKEVNLLIKTTYPKSSISSTFLHWLVSRDQIFVSLKTIFFTVIILIKSILGWPCRKICDSIIVVWLCVFWDIMWLFLDVKWDISIDTNW